MLETIQGDLYDYPKYYDLVYGSDWKAEFDFLEDCFERHADGVVERLFEPACGTGRLLIKFADVGYEVAGVDLNPKAIDYCNARLDRAGYPPSTFVGDMCDFQIDQPVDAAFNTINSFRHLGTQKAGTRSLAGRRRRAPPRRAVRAGATPDTNRRRTDPRRKLVGPARKSVCAIANVGAQSRSKKTLRDGRRHF